MNLYRHDWSFKTVKTQNDMSFTLRHAASESFNMKNTPAVQIKSRQVSHKPR